jgi:homopolymeric O-antigen transport system permease protein
MNQQFAAANSLGASSILRIESKKNWVALNLRELWEFRELFYFLVWRDVKVRYKQTVIGVAWSVIQPLVTMVVFTVIFSKIANVPSDGLPYPIFAFTALLPWTYFSQAISRSSGSLVGSAGMIKKVYFPRLIIPISAAITPLFDFALSFAVLVGMMAWYKITPTWGVLLLPLLMIWAFTTALAVGIFTSAVHVRYRDVGYAIPFLMQIWMFMSPIFYSVNMIPAQWRSLYSLNPMVGIIEGFRWALLGKNSPDLYLVLLSAMVVSIILFGGVVYFKRVERLFADVV